VGGWNSGTSYLPSVGSVMILMALIIAGFCGAIHFDDYRDKRHAEKWQRLLDTEHNGNLNPYDYELESN